MKRIAFTSITTNYLPKARVLAHSVKRHTADISFVLVVAEPFDMTLLRPDDPFDRVIPIADLGIPNLRQWLFMHSVVETCTAIKGYAMVNLLTGDGDVAVLYFDPDIVVLDCLDGLFAEFESASVLLTPHGTEPEVERRAIIDNEISHLRYGVYNLGFLGVRNTEAGLKFAGWWAQRLYDFCYDDIPKGLFTDQRWADLAPCLFDGVHVLRNPGYNVATWNLSHRVVTGSPTTGFQVNGHPLVFYHFSGFDSGAMETMLEVYGQRSPALNAFRDWYVAECQRMGQDELGSRPWLFSQFDNGEFISKAQRLLYRHRADVRDAFSDPFSTRTPESSFLNWYRRQAARDHALPARVDGEYEILVMAFDDSGDPEGNLAHLLAHTWNRSSVVVVGTASVCDRLAGTAARLPVLEVSDDVATGNKLEAWVLSRIAQSRRAGAIFVQLGLAIPELWDFRLHAAAGRDPSVVTVSPLYDGVPTTALFPSGSAHPQAEAELVDRLVCDLSDHRPVESPQFSHECFYVNVPLAQRVLISPSGARSEPARHMTSLTSFAQTCRIRGYSHGILTDTYVGTNTTRDHQPLTRRRRSFQADSSEYRHMLDDIRSQYACIDASDAGAAPTVPQRLSRRHLHLCHSWGGGLEGWVRSYCGSDTDHVNMVLRPVGGSGGYGSEIELFANISAASSIARWRLPVPIKATTAGSTHYRRILDDIIAEYGIDVIFVSSLIGHSMDALKTGLATVFVCHDFFPLVPEIYLRSRHLSGNRVANFSIKNSYKHGRPPLFKNVSLAEAAVAHQAFSRIVLERRMTLVAPSPSTRQLYLDLIPGLNPDDIHVIPHGIPVRLLEAPCRYSTAGKLRIVIPGRVAPEKGSALLAQVLPDIAQIADVLLLGCGTDGEQLADIPGVDVLSRYEPDQLPAILNEFQPHVGLLLSDFPETYSYTLAELMAMAIPPVTVRIGAFVDRIQDQRNGFLVDNDATSVVLALRVLDRDRDRLQAARVALEHATPRTELDMVRDYELLLSLPRFSRRALHAVKRLPVATYNSISPGIESVGLPQPTATTNRGIVAGTPRRAAPFHRGSAGPRPPARRSERLPQRKYLDLISQIRHIVSAHVPENAMLGVVSRGDDRLLNVPGRRACHVPQVRGGIYAGAHPADSGEAIAHIELLRSRGVGFLVFPQTSFWWLEYYRELTRHLNTHYSQLVHDDTCVIFALVEQTGVATTLGQPTVGAAAGRGVD